VLAPKHNGKNVCGAQDWQRPGSGVPGVSRGQDHQRRNEGTQAWDAGFCRTDRKRAQDAKKPLPGSEMRDQMQSVFGWHFLDGIDNHKIDRGPSRFESQPKLLH